MLTDDAAADTAAAFRYNIATTAAAVAVVAAAVTAAVAQPW